MSWPTGFGYNSAEIAAVLSGPKVVIVWRKKNDCEDIEEDQLECFDR